MNRSIQLKSELQRIALYGGSFDPVHDAHLALARAALDSQSLDAVIFIPAAQSPLKTENARVSDQARVEMLRLATAGEPRFKVDTRELERGGVSYTVDTVRSFSEEYPEAQIYWILGGDQFALLPRWRSIESLMKMLSFLVVRRPDEPMRAPELDGLRYEWLDAALMTHSSSEIRELLGRSDSISAMVPASVEAFISEHGLYTT